MGLAILLGGIKKEEGQHLEMYTVVQEEVQLPLLLHKFIPVKQCQLTFC